MTLATLSQNAANAIYSISGVVLAIGAVMTLLGTLGAIWSGGVRDKYANERIVANETMTAQANAAAFIAKEKAAALEAEAAAARLELERLKAKQADWVLAPVQRERLVADLAAAPKGKVEISYTMAEAERGGKFAKVLDAIFKESGHKVDKEIGVFSDHDAVSGVYVNFGADEEKERALAYCRAFLNVGIISKWYKRKPENEAMMPWLKGTVCVTIRNKP